MNWLDFVFVAIVMVGAYLGMRTGVIRAAFTALGAVVGIMIAGQLSDDVAARFAGSTSDDTVVTVITSFVYPLVSRSGRTVAGFMSRNSPSLLREYLDNLSRSLTSMQAAFTLQGQVASDIRRSGRVILANFGVILVLIGVGTFALGFATELAAMAGISDGMLGMAVGGVVVLLCAPPAVFIWRSLKRMTDELSAAIIRRGTVSISLWGGTDLHDVLQDSILVAMAVLLAIWSLPLVSQLVIMGSFSAPIPIMLLLGLVALLWRVAFKIHNSMVNAFNKTFLGESDSRTEQKPEPQPAAVESPLFERNFRRYRTPR